MNDIVSNIEEIKKMIEANNDEFAPYRLLYVDYRIFLSNKTALEFDFLVKEAEDIDHYKKILDHKANKEFSGQIYVVSSSVHQTYTFYSIIADKVDYDKQKMFDPNFSLKEEMKTSVTLVRGDCIHYCFSSELEAEINSVGFAEDEKEFMQNYMELYVAAVNAGYNLNPDQPVEECCCAAGMGGGVTTASFAPAVTHTMFSKPKKKKKSKKEDSDDVYWPVRDDETDAFEKKIMDARRDKKDKIIARKERTIQRREEALQAWLERVDGKMDLVKMANMYKKYNQATQKIRVELERIKRLPLSSPEFL